MDIKRPSRPAPAPRSPALASEPRPSAPADPRSEPAAPALPEEASKAARDFARAQADGSAPPGQGSPALVRMRALLGDDGIGDGARDSADGAQGSLDSVALLTGAPGAVDPSPATEGGGSIDADGRYAWASGTRAKDGESDTVSATLAAGFSVDYERARGSGSTGFGAFYVPGYLGLSLSHAWADRNGGARSLSGYFDVSATSVGGSVGAKRTDKEGRTTSGSLYSSVNIDRQLTDLGPGDERDPATKGKRKVELTRSLGGGASLSPGAATRAIGLGGRLAASCGRSVVYRTHMDEARARALVFEHEGVKGAVSGFFTNKGRALGLVDDPVLVPDLSAPESLKPGDEVVVTTSGAVSLGLFLGGLGVGLGAQGVLSGELELAVRKASDDVVQLVVTPTRVRGVQLRAGAPVLLDADLSGAAAKALRQSFVFDLKDPAARAAYQKALKGELPGGTPAKAGADEGADEAALKRALEQERLPSGVARGFVESVDVKRAQRGLGVGFALWWRGGSFVGLGAQKVSAREDRSVVDGHGFRGASTRGVESRRQVLLSGSESRGVFASVKRNTTFDDDGRPLRRFAGLALTARFSDSKVRGDELNDEVIARVNDAFGTKLAPFARDGHKESREVTLSRTLDEGDLEALARAGEAGLARAAKEAGVTERLARSFARDLQRAQGGLAKADVVQGFVADAGIKGFGALHRALEEAARSEGRLALETTSSAYDKPAEKLQELSFRYPPPPPGDITADDLKARFAKVEKALEDTREARLDAKSDPLLEEDARAEIAKKLAEAERELEALIAVEHLSPASRRALWGALDRGWTTGLERRLMRHLEAAGLE